MAFRPLIVAALVVCFASGTHAVAQVAVDSSGWSTSTSIVEANGKTISGPSAGSPAVVPVGPLNAETLHANVSALGAQAESVHQVRPFSALAVQVKGGFAGFGLDIATPLAQRFNLRLGGNFYQYNGSYNADGIDINGDVHFRSGSLYFDYFPFNNAFRLSAGVVYNGNNVRALANVPGGQSFDLGDETYVSSMTDPVHGNASLTFGHHVAPSVTAGFGNMIPRSGRHFSFPFEIGVVFLGDPPALTFGLNGTACDGSGNCGDIASDPTTQANLQQEENDINSDITALRFYPIVSFGIAYKF